MQSKLKIGFPKFAIKIFPHFLISFLTTLKRNLKSPKAPTESPSPLIPHFKYFPFYQQQWIVNPRQLIKEQKMTETLFEIASFNRPLYASAPTASNGYASLAENFSATSYALYTEYFIKKIAAEAEAMNAGLYRLCVKKSLRKCVKKFMLTDLEVVFVGFFCRQGAWGIGMGDLLRGIRIQSEGKGEESGERDLELFLDLNAYFVKFYVGNVQEFQAIQDYLEKTFPEFAVIYEKWVLSKPREMFQISPRQINEIYRQYSRNNELESNKKSYNDLVQTLIELSTTYSIIPNKKVERKERDRQRQRQRERGYQQKSRERYEQREQARRNEQSGSKRYRNGSEIFQIAENSGIVEEESEIPRLNMDFIGNGNGRAKRKSSLLFESLQSLSRKSQRMQTRNRQDKQPKQQHYRQKSKQKEEQPERSREKKPNKISLSFKRKQQKPNETVLGFIKHPSILNAELEDRPKAGQKDKQGYRERDNRSIINHSIREHNLSFINLRSNRSSRSNSQLPFLWKPSQDNFFEKSKFG